MISFSLDEEQELVQSTVRKLAAELVRPRMRAWEKAGEVDDGARRALFELSLPLVDVPEAMGGAGQPLVTAMIAHEELAFGDAGAAVALVGAHLVPQAIAALCDGETGRRLLEPFTRDPLARGAIAWSEPTAGASPEGAFSTTATAVDGGYALRGDKCFVVNGGLADLTLVFARVESGGVGAFAVVGRPPGMVAGERRRTLGLETVHIADLRFDDLRLPTEARLDAGGDGEPRIARFFRRAALFTAARQVGLARASYETALAYTQERHAFGKPVAHFQSIAFTLADMLMDVESARLLVLRAAAAVDAEPAPGAASAGSGDDARGSGDERARLVAEAAVQANEAGFRVANAAVQLLGGAGYVQDFPVEKWLRDTKTLALCAPTDEHQRLAAAAASGLGPLAPRWPHPALQPIVT